MKELLAYFHSVSLPTQRLNINRYCAVIENGGAGFIESCKRMYERGDEQGLTFLQDYKATIERINEQAATDQSGTVAVSGQ